MKMRYIATGLTVVLLSGVWGGSCIVRDRSLRRNFAAISDGTTQDQVLRIMGAPWKVGGCYGEFAPYDLDKCAETYVYASTWAPLNPEYPVVWFDRRNLVIGKFDFSSP